MNEPTKIPFWQSNAVRMLTADVLSDVAIAFGVTAAVVTDTIDVNLATAWLLVGLSAAKKGVLMLARMVGVGTSGDSPAVAPPAP